MQLYYAFIVSDVLREISRYTGYPRVTECSFNEGFTIAFRARLLLANSKREDIILVVKISNYLGE